MMKYYQELTLLPDSEIPLPALWSKVYETVHIALAEDGSGEIGISFPAYGNAAFPLGDKMRIIALIRKIGIRLVTSRHAQNHFHSILKKRNRNIQVGIEPKR